MPLGPVHTELHGMYRLQHKTTGQYLIHGGRVEKTTKDVVMAGLWPLRYLRQLWVNPADWHYIKVHIIDAGAGEFTELLSKGDG